MNDPMGRQGYFLTTVDDHHHRAFSNVGFLLARFTESATFNDRRWTYGQSLVPLALCALALSIFPCAITVREHSDWELAMWGATDAGGSVRRLAT
jgi:hypothetical protein